MTGFRKTGLLAANAFRTFLAFIFKNALAANNGFWPAGENRGAAENCRVIIGDYCGGGGKAKTAALIIKRLRKNEACGVMRDA